MLAGKQSFDDRCGGRLAMPDARTTSINHLAASSCMWRPYGERKHTRGEDGSAPPSDRQTDGNKCSAKTLKLAQVFMSRKQEVLSNATQDRGGGVSSIDHGVPLNESGQIVRSVFAKGRLRAATAAEVLVPGGIGMFRLRHSAGVGQPWRQVVAAWSC